MSAPTTVGVGLIGCGTIGYWQHLRNLKRLGGVRIAGLADPDPEALRRAVQRVEAPCFPEPASLLAQESVDAVVIASPAGLHAEQVIAACAAGKHVYVEKPLAHDAASLAQVRERVRERDAVVAVGYNYRFHPGCRNLRQAIRSGSIGPVQAVSSQFTESVDGRDWPEWRRDPARGGGVLLDLATHHLDLYRWLLGDELGEVRIAVSSRRLDQDSAWVRAGTRGGVELGGYFAHGGSRSHDITVHGARGMLHLDLHSGRLDWARDRTRGYGIRRRRLNGGPRGWVYRALKQVRPAFDPSHAASLRAFIEAVRDPARPHPDLAHFEDGAAALDAVFGSIPERDPRSSAGADSEAL